jgi:hypothetical protein
MPESSLTVYCAWCGRHIPRFRAIRCVDGLICPEHKQEGAK